jgi:diaminopimelate decarboxylase
LDFATNAERKHGVLYLSLNIPKRPMLSEGAPMTLTCTTSPSPHAVKTDGALPLDVPCDVLQSIVRSYGTPTYAYDIARIRSQVDKLKTNFPREVEFLYSLKANPSLGLCGVLASSGLGADIASAGELATALKAGFSKNRIYLTGPDRSPHMMAVLRSTPELIVSVDSASELRLMAAQKPTHRALLRLRPDFCSYASCSAGPDSRFGLMMDELASCRPYLDTVGKKVIGFHVFSGSQVLSVEGITHHMRGGLDEALRAAKFLEIAPQVIALGGGFGIPYGPEDQELDLVALGREFRSLVERAAPARLVVELGRFFVAQSGWYLTTVLTEQSHRGRPAVVVDGGSHQRGDMCGLGLRHKGFPPVVLTKHVAQRTPTDVLGCLSLPGDVLAEAKSLPPLGPGDVLAFPNAGAYGLGASPWQFHAQPAPAEIAFLGTQIFELRSRQNPESVLDGQCAIRINS